MELKQVRYALAVHACGNFTRAAAHAKVTQPTLTQAMGRLEEELGAPLFVRDRAGSQPTALGVKLLPVFEDLIAMADRATQLAEEHVKLRQVPIRFGLADSLGFRFLSEALAMFERENSDVEFEFKVLPNDALNEGLQDATLDLVAGSIANFDSEEFRVDPLYSEKYYVLFHKGHRFSGKESLCVSDLSNEVLLDRPNCEMRDRLLEVISERDVGLYAHLRANSYGWMLSQVRDAVGVAVVPESLLGDCPDDVGFLELGDVPLIREIGLVRAALQPTHTVTQKLVNSLRKTLKVRGQSGASQSSAPPEV